MDTSLRSQVADAVLDGATDAIISSDAEGIIRFWNPGAVRLFGFTEAEALGRSLDIIIPDRLRARHWEGYAKVMRTGQSRYAEGDVLAVPALRKDGSQISVEFTLMALRDDSGGLTGLVAVLRDVTVRFEEAKALRRRLREALVSAAASSGA